MNNKSPVVGTPIADQTNLAVGTPWEFSFPENTFTDADSDPLTYTASGVPSWMSFNGAERKFTGTPVSGSQGSSVITVTARDTSGNTGIESFIVQGQFSLKFHRNFLTFSDLQ